MFYAIRTIDGNEVNEIKNDWQEVKPLVFNKNSIYKAFTSYDEATNYLNEVDISKLGYERTSKEANVIYARFLFSRKTSDENGYTVSIYQTKLGQRVTCVGVNLPRLKNITYKFNGKYSTNSKYGNEFKVDTFEAVIEDTREGVIAYLSSGVIKGVGVKKAEAIYEKFGIHTMEVLEKEPERLKYVKGFSTALAKRAAEDLEKNRGAKEITQYLLRFGISQKYAMALYNDKGQNALMYVKNNPYRLCGLFNISFDTADEIASDVGIPKNNEDRLKQAIFHTLLANEINGDTGMEWNAFTKTVFNIIGPEVTKEDLSNVIVDLYDAGALRLIALKRDGKQGKYLFLNAAYEREYNIAKNIIRIKKSLAYITINEIDKKITDIEKVYGIKLDECQKDAIELALSGEPLLVIKGKPGTGKTTVIKMIADLYEKECPNIVFMAPTGRAQRRMTETSGRPAHTIHSKLNIFEDDVQTEEVKLEKSLVVVDELSMLDVHTAKVLFSSIDSGCRVVLVGDPNQLPSVGPGAILRDLINSNAVKIASLTTVHRQKEESKIYTNCEKINAGDISIEDGEDFEFIESASMEDIKNVMAEKYLGYVKEYGLLNCMCLCPFKKYTAGVIDMNNTLQDLTNPKTLGKAEIRAHGEIFREGDPVMHLKNKKEASNGDIGVIKSIDEEERKIIVDINETLLEFDKDSLDRLTRAYASTIHKAQGSEADAVVFCFSTFHKAMHYKNIPYVAISRGKKKVSVIGEKAALNKAIKCERKNTRVTLLEMFLRYEDGQFIEV